MELFLLPRDYFSPVTLHWAKYVDFCPALEAWKRAKFVPAWKKYYCLGMKIKRYIFLLKANKYLR